MGAIDVRALYTLKEMRILDLIVEGYTNKEIAELIGNTEHVTKNYLREIYDKSGMWHRTELALWWLSKRACSQST